MKIQKPVSAPETQRKIKRSYLTIATVAAAAIVMANFLSALPRAGTKRNAKSVATKTVTPMMRLEANISPATATPAKTAPK